MSSPFFNRNKASALVALALVVALMAGTVLAAPFARQDGPLGRLQEQADGSIRVHIYELTGVARWIDSSRGVLTRGFAG